MVDDTPLTRPGDRFPIGLAGHTVPISTESPTPGRPWGMDHAVVTIPAPVPHLDKHKKPTKTFTETRGTKGNMDGKVVPDTQTVTVTVTD
ncbi:hypothetical protein GCM10017673_51120 [Streptosporangium violaceochromogenes]|nr:hypothetical protein GCM10017673_51120 [Streptosporangium violaceochromogenes]